MCKMTVGVLQHREYQNRASTCNQKSHIRKHSTHPLGNIGSWYSHSCHESATARAKTPRLRLYKTLLPLACEYVFVTT